MSGCGYVCPVCEGKGYTDTGVPCDYCTPEKKPAISPTFAWFVTYKWVAPVIKACCVAV